MNPEVFYASTAFIDDWLHYRQKEVGWPGIAVRITNGQQSYTSGFGEANTETGAHMSTDAVYRIASQSKTFTSVALLQLVEKEYISLDDTVCTYLPQLLNGADDRLGSVTLKHILQNAAGFSRDGQNADHWELAKQFPTRENVLEVARSERLIYGPGEVMKYSNLGFALLGQVVEKVADTPYDDYIHKNILDTLDLSNTGTDVHENGSLHISPGYGRSHHGVRSCLPHVPTNGFSPATGFYSTLADVSSFYETLLVGNSTSLLHSHTIERMQQEQIVVPSSPGVRYGLGLDIGEFAKRTVVGHGGGIPGHISATLVDRAEKTTVSCFVNCIDADAFALCSGIFRVIDFFKDNQAPTREERRSMSRRLRGLWQDKQIVALGNRIVAFDPSTWEPFSLVEELEYVSTNILRVASANGFESMGEKIEYPAHTAAGALVRYCGRSMTILDR